MVRPRSAVAAVALAALAAAALVGARGAAAKPAFVYGGYATVRFDPTLMTSYGVTVESRSRAKPTADGGVRYSIYDGTTTRVVPLTSLLLTAGNLGLEQPATTNDVNFTDFRVALKPSKSVMSAESGAGVGYGGPRQTLLRLAPTARNVSIKGSALILRRVPITLTAAGATVMTNQFASATGLPPFAIGQQVGTLDASTHWYIPNRKKRR